MKQQYDESMLALKEEARNRVTTVKTLYDNEMTKLKKRYLDDTDLLESHIQTLEEKMVKLHIDLHGEENIDDLDIPSYELPQLKISSFSLESNDFATPSKTLNKIKTKSSDVSSVHSVPSTVTCVAEEEVRPESPFSASKSVRDVVSRLVSSSGSQALEYRLSEGVNEVTQQKKENRLLRTKLKDLNRVSTE